VARLGLNTISEEQVAADQSLLRARHVRCSARGNR
jgi:hypothetical protein